MTARREWCEVCGCNRNRSCSCARECVASHEWCGCEWYAACTNAAVGTSPHSVLGNVPICQRCADKHELVLVPFGRVNR